MVPFWAVPWPRRFALRICPTYGSDFLDPQRYTRYSGAVAVGLPAWENYPPLRQWLKDTSGTNHQFRLAVTPTVTGVTVTVCKRPECAAVDYVGV